MGRAQPGGGRTVQALFAATTVALALALLLALLAACLASRLLGLAVTLARLAAAAAAAAAAEAKDCILKVVPSRGARHVSAVRARAAVGQHAQPAQGMGGGRARRRLAIAPAGPPHGAACAAAAAAASCARAGAAVAGRGCALFCRCVAHLHCAGPRWKRRARPSDCLWSDRCLR